MEELVHQLAGAPARRTLPPFFAASMSIGIPTFLRLSGPLEEELV